VREWLARRYGGVAFDVSVGITSISTGYGMNETQTPVLRVTATAKN